MLCCQFKKEISGIFDNDFFSSKFYYWYFNELHVSVRIFLWKRIRFRTQQNLLSSELIANYEPGMFLFLEVIN
jgi:hypothetical protein